MDVPNVLVKKNNGKYEHFSFEKLSFSLKNSGANQEEIQNVIDRILPELYDGISSKEIYKKAFKTLKRFNKISASKYSLKRAIIDLGPTGYPFEKLISALLKQKGYTTQVGVVLPGKCVRHEIDVLAEKDNFIYAIECKFHAFSNAVNNIKTPLYINSRFLDIQEQWNNNARKKTFLKQGWLVTNTRFSEDAIKYAECVGLTLLSWDYPVDNSIQTLINQYKLYPITTLLSLTKREKKLLIVDNIILTTEFANTDADTLEKIGIKKQRIPTALREAKKLCKLDDRSFF